jgi:SAM-dependent methyltransferase
LNQTNLSLTSTIANWWRFERQYASRASTAKQLAGLTWEFLRDSLPDRKRQRYGDAEYDWEYRVDTTSGTVGWRIRFLGLFHSGYQPIEPQLFREMLSKLEIDFHQFTFIDIGSGKGRALLIASEYPFRKIMGIELMPELNEIAQANIRKLTAGKPEEINIQAICGDATQFPFPEGPVVVYFFNPLPAVALDIVVTNLVQSLQTNPRPIYVIYANPIWEASIIRTSLFTKIASTLQYAIFSHLPSNR